MVINIYTKEEFTKENSIKRFGKQVVRNLESGKLLRYKNNFILKANWNNLVTELTDENKNIYN